MIIKLAFSYIKKQKGKTIPLLAGVGLAVMLIFSMLGNTRGQSLCVIRNSSNQEGPTLTGWFFFFYCQKKV